MGSVGNPLAVNGTTTHDNARTMLHLRSDVVGAAPLADSIRTQLAELYSENVTAKIVRAALEQLKDNVREAETRHFHFTVHTDQRCHVESSDPISRDCSTVGPQQGPVPVERSRVLDQWLLSRLYLRRPRARHPLPVQSGPIKRRCSRRLAHSEKDTGGNRQDLVRPSLRSGQPHQHPRPGLYDHAAHAPSLGVLPGPGCI